MNLNGTEKEGLIVKFSSGFRIKFYGEQYHQLWLYYDKCTLPNIEKQVINDGMLAENDILQFWPDPVHQSALKWYKIAYDIINSLCMDMSYELVNVNHSELGKMLKPKKSGKNVINWRSDLTKPFLFKGRSSIDNKLWKNINVEDIESLNKLSAFMLNSKDWRVTLFQKHKNNKTERTSQY